MTNAELKERREALRLTRAAFAALLGVPARTLEGWEQGRFRVPPHLDRAIRDLEREARTA